MAGVVTPTVWLVRHGRTAWTGKRYCGRADLPLSRAGTKDAEALSVRLGEHLDATARIRTSPSRRAAMTAAAIARATGAMPPMADNRLVEVDFGTVEGRTWDDLRADHPELATAILRGARVDWPGGETDRSLMNRAAVFWRDVSPATGEPLVVVSHGLAIGALLDVVTCESPADTTGGPGLSAIPAAAAIGLARVAGRWIVTSRVGPGW